MDDIEIISKYVVMVECPHCEGSGTCTCDRCKDEIKSKVNSGPFYSFGLRCHPGEEGYEEYIKKRDEQKKQWESKKPEEARRLKGECQRCCGKGKEEIMDRETLCKEVKSGLITEAVRQAIYTKILTLVPRLDTMNTSWRNKFP